jgi:AmpD protein
MGGWRSTDGLDQNMQRGPFTLDTTTGLIREARQVASPNCDARPDGAEIGVLVVHAISLPPREYGGGYIERFFANRLDPGEHPYFAEIADLRVSAHFLVARDGGLVQFVPTHLRAWHAGLSRFQGREQVNDFSIGIELEGCDEHPFEDNQYRTLSLLVDCLMRAYPAIRREAIVGHCDVAPGRKTDPGPCFDWQCLHGELDRLA